MLLLDGQVHHDTHPIPMGNYVSEVGNYLSANPSDLGNYVSADIRADSQVTMAEDLTALAPQLGLLVDGPAGEVAAQVVAALGSRQDWLVVFDNAQNSKDLVGMIPSGDGHVLITSRSRGWGGTAAQLSLGVFTRSESVTFLSRRTQRDEPHAARELATELGDLPLALAQAAAYIDSRGITIVGYLGLYRDPAVAARLRAEALESDEYPESVARTWLMHFDRLSREKPAAIELLRLCAFLDPDDIDLELLVAGAAETGEALAAALADPLERTETVGALARASLVTILGEGRLRVHRLVQAVTRDQLDSDQTDAWIRRAVRLIAAVLPDPPEDHRSWPVYARLAAHINAVAVHAVHSPDLLPNMATLHNRLGIYLSASAQLNVAQDALTHALAIKETSSEPDDLQVAATLTNLGIVQRQLMDLPAARTSLARSLAILETAYGTHDSQVAIVLTNLGAVQTQLRDLPAARTSLEHALKISNGEGYRRV